MFGKNKDIVNDLKTNKKIVEAIGENDDYTWGDFFQAEAIADYNVYNDHIINRMIYSKILNETKYCLKMQRLYFHTHGNQKTHIIHNMIRTINACNAKGLSENQKAMILASYYGGLKQFSPRVIRECRDRLNAGYCALGMPIPKTKKEIEEENKKENILH